MEYTARHIGGGSFEVTLEGGEVKQAGSGIVGMIRYTYFEDFAMPPVGWEVTREKLMADYVPKVHADIASGKIAPGRHDMGQTDWIEK